MDRAGHLTSEAEKSRASDVPSASLDEKIDAPSTSSGESIRSQRGDQVAQNDVKEKELQVDDGEPNEEIVGVEDGTEGKLEPVKSKQPSVNNASSIPDGGLWAWLQVLGAFFLFFNSWFVILPTSPSHHVSLFLDIPK